MGLELVEMVMDIEAACGIEVPRRDAGRLRTVGDWYGYLRARLAPDGTPPAAGGPGDPAWERLLDVIERITGLERAQLRADADLIRDLGMG